MIQAIENNSLQCPNCGEKLSEVLNIREEQYKLDEFSCPYCGCPLDDEVRAMGCDQCGQCAHIAISRSSRGFRVEFEDRSYWGCRVLREKRFLSPDIALKLDQEYAFCEVILPAISNHDVVVKLKLCRFMSVFLPLMGELAKEVGAQCTG